MEAGVQVTFEALKTRNREVRDGFTEPVRLRLHRAISWLGRAEVEREDDAVRFILLWIGFNATYARHAQGVIGSERDLFRDFFQRILAGDATGRVYNAVWSRFPQEVRVLLDNRYIYGPFWRHQNGEPGFADWETQLARDVRTAHRAIAVKDTARLLAIVFDRLYVLRNQLLHGGATWNGSVNRNQLRDGAAILGWMLPIFIDTMMDCPDADWGQPRYPVVDKPDSTLRFRA